VEVLLWTTCTNCRRKRAVYFSLQAEMGATIFYYPKEYRSMIYSVKDVIGKSGTPKSLVKVSGRIYFI
jgi:hypothetical protein